MVKSDKKKRKEKKMNYQKDKNIADKSFHLVFAVTFDIKFSRSIYAKPF